MPVLRNARHERFAQELAKGKSQSEAYEAAGYNPSRSAAARLAADVNICARLAEIQGRAAVRAEITVATITDRLLAIATKAEEKDEASMLQVARASLMDAAKLNGLIIDKADLTSSDGSLSPKPTIIEFVAPDASDD
ncbi:terminase small subunit [Phenylobacterium kunshanense]|uniref:Terminase small subunit n=1 Tax=Phenylobacterium kunshanense TaxID=1445034 RepID=A0A328BNY1_9CAUL|nr:terminase small subunit [Phenylobacterium kunshanense]RAK68803.1 hypothetical protein DJ019_01970 [Phenylobacterium kunshanense]